jgi:hypothetical protein
MTTASVQEPAQQAFSTQDRQGQPNNTGNPIPVLIRLPDLATATISEQAGSEPECATQPSLPSPHDEGGAGNAGSSQSITKDGSNATTSRLPIAERPKGKAATGWSEFRLPSWLVRASVALALIAVFVVAYMVIVGGGGSEETAADKPAASGAKSQASAGSREVATEEDSALGIDFDSFTPREAQTPAGAKPASAKQPAARAKKSAAKSKQRPETNPAAGTAEPRVANVQGPATGSQPARATTRPIAEEEDVADSVQQTEFKTPANSSTGQSAPAEDHPASQQGQTQRPPGAGNEPAATRPKDAAAGSLREDSSSVQPLTSGNVEAATNQTADSETVYPVTNPTSYLYPADYHERLVSRADAQGSPRNSPWSGGTTEYDRGTSTARLRPRIEPPPPIR